MQAINIAIPDEWHDNTDSEYSFTEKDINDFETRRTSRLNGQSKVYNWEKVKDKIIPETGTSLAPLNF